MTVPVAIGLDERTHFFQCSIIQYFSVVVYAQAQTLFQCNTHLDAAAAGRCDPMFDCVLNQRLHSHAWHAQIESIRRNLLLYYKPVAKAQLHKQEIRIRHLYFFAHERQMAAPSVQRSVEQYAQCLYHLRNGGIFVHPCLPEYDLQRVVQKVGINAALHRLDASVPQRDLDFVGFVDQIAHLQAHRRKCRAQPPQFIFPVHGDDQAQFTFLNAR